MPSETDMLGKMRKDNVTWNQAGWHCEAGRVSLYSSLGSDALCRHPLFCRIATSDVQAAVSEQSGMATELSPNGGDPNAPP